MTTAKQQLRTSRIILCILFLISIFYFPRFVRISEKKNRDSIGCYVHNSTLLPMNDGLLTSFTPQCKHHQDENIHIIHANDEHLPNVCANLAHICDHKVSGRDGEIERVRENEKAKEKKSRRQIVIAWDKTRHNCRFDGVYACNTRWIHNTRINKISQPLVTQHFAGAIEKWRGYVYALTKFRVITTKTAAITHRNEYTSTPNCSWFLSLRQLNVHKNGIYWPLQSDPLWMIVFVYLSEQAGVLNQPKCMTLNACVRALDSSKSFSIQILVKRYLLHTFWHNTN